ncbi:MAG: CoA ester lyase [Gammaproteobacteria bacterium]|nr:CoA ester lyase [Gammaproteobacteria bacterium]
MMLRSMLFVPGDSEKKLAKGASCGADALILDLEDAVAASRRPVAREMTREYLKSADRSKGELWVRMNPIDSDDALKDLAAVVCARPDGIAIPKTESGADILRLSHYLDALEVEAGIPLGAVAIFAIATETAGAAFGLGTYKGVTPRLRAITWGAEDLSAALGASSNKGDDGQYTHPYVLARSLCLYAAHHAEVQAIDTVLPDFRDSAKLKKECEDARRDGYTGKICIHPDQVAVINAAFSPTEAELAQARAVIDAFAAQPDAGTLQLNGKMLDKPHLKQAERIMALVDQARR